MFYRFLAILIICLFLLSCYHTDKYLPYRPKKPKACADLVAQSSTDTIKGTKDTTKEEPKEEPKEKKEKPEPSVIDKLKDKIQKLEPKSPATGPVRG